MQVINTTASKISAETTMNCILHTDHDCECNKDGDHNAHGNSVFHLQQHVVAFLFSFLMFSITHSHNTYKHLPLIFETQPSTKNKIHIRIHEWICTCQKYRETLTNYFEMGVQFWEKFPYHLLIKCDTHANKSEETLFVSFPVFPSSDITWRPLFRLRMKIILQKFAKLWTVGWVMAQETVNKNRHHSKASSPETKKPEKKKGLTINQSTLEARRQMLPKTTETNDWHHQREWGENCVKRKWPMFVLEAKRKSLPQPHIIWLLKKKERRGFQG